MSIFKEKMDNSNLLHSLFEKMQNVVDSVVEPKFKSDFEINDRSTLERSNTPGIYAWFVYNYGTHLFALNDMKQVMEFQKDWLLHQSAADANTGYDRLYVLNVFSGELKRIYEYGSYIQSLVADRLERAAG